MLCIKNFLIHELTSRAAWVCNNEEQHKGYSPLQQVLGRAPDEYGRMFENEEVRPIHPSILDDGGFKEDVQMRCRASQAFAEEQAKRRLERGERMGSRATQIFVPGDLVFYWRNQVPLKEKTTQKAGRFLGPARVLATETRRTAEGELRPGSIVWLHKAGRLLKAAPEQLRHASPFEMTVEALAGPVELPWTMMSLATHGKRQVFQDISKEVPSDEEWAEGKTLSGKRGIVEEPHRRMRQKGRGEERLAKRTATEAKLPEKRGGLSRRRCQF